MNPLLKYITLPALVLLCCFELAAQQRTRIAGLESDNGYATLLQKEERLTHSADSLGTAMNRARELLRNDRDNRAAHTAAILRMEDEMFALRGEIGAVTGELNTMEQEWILKNLGTGNNVAAAHVSGAVNGEPQSPNLVFNAFFDRALDKPTCRELREAQTLEAKIPAMVNGFRENNEMQAGLQRLYDRVPSPDTAAIVKNAFDSLAAKNRELAIEIGSTWGKVFDSKSYSYNLAMDINNQTEILQWFEEQLATANNLRAELKGKKAADEITDYLIQKRVLLNYEIELAGLLNYKPAKDSLEKARRKLPDINDYQLPPITLHERLFLDYADIKVNPAAVYNAKNPIPETQTFEKGVIYRVLLGTFAAPQQPAAFRNISPLSVQRGPDGKYRYFAGGFTSEAEAQNAVETVRKRGFRRPEAVVWADGVYINPAAEQGTAKAFYRVEISGAGELPADISNLIRETADGKEIVRAGDILIVGPMDSPMEALRLRNALEAASDTVSVRLAEIRE